MDHKKQEQQLYSEQIRTRLRLSHRALVSRQSLMKVDSVFGNKQFSLLTVQKPQFTVDNTGKGAKKGPYVGLNNSAGESTTTGIDVSTLRH